ncbi:MAG: YfiR family protein [Terracidiphilus sp.]
MWIALCVLTSAAHPENRVSAYDVESAYLSNFGKFVRFAPSDAEGGRHSFDICIVGEDPLGATLDQLTGSEQLDGKPVRVVRVKSAVEARNCAIAYFSATEENRLGSELEALRGHAVLTVSDAGEFLKLGGMIQLIVAENHVRFAVNLDAVHSAHLSLSSELLRVAVSVNGEPPTGVR